MDKGIDPGRDFYVAPSDPPDSRRPPLTEVGIVGWLRENLFKTPVDIVLTLVTLGVTLLIVRGVLRWAFFDAQWEVVFLNQRILMSGLQFPVEALWRVESAAMIVLFLSLLSVGVWGRLMWRAVLVIAIALFMLFLVPALTEPIEEPTIHYYMDSEYLVRQVNFIAEEGEEYTFTIDPLTSRADFSVSQLRGYIENDNRQSNTTFDSFNSAINQVNPLAGREATLDPSEYDLSLAVQIWDNEGNVVAMSPFSKGATDSLSWTWAVDNPAGTPQEGWEYQEVEAAEDDAEAEASEAIELPTYDDDDVLDNGWYTFTFIREGEAEEEPASAGGGGRFGGGAAAEAETPFNNTGVAFVEIDGMTVFRSTLGAAAEREDTYGPQPELDCSGCATSVNRTDMRFEGQRSLAEWFSLQLAPYFLEIRGTIVLAVIVGAVAYFVGRSAKRVSFLTEGDAKPIERLLLIITGLWVLGYIGVQLTRRLAPEPDLSSIQLFISVTLILTLFLYTLVQFAKEDPKFASRGVTLLWLLSIPVMFYVLIGFSPSPEAAEAGQAWPYEQIETELFGGLLLTMILSVVAILISFPIGMGLALGRQTNLPIISLLCTIFIEVFRGVPLITLLFMGTFIVPFVGFGLGDVDLVIRILVVLTLFTSAYMAEVIRGGLQVIPKGQLEASYALGLNNFWTTTLITLPQALRAVIPAMMGQAVSLFKDTTLVYLIGLFDVLGVMYQVLGDAATGYTAFPREGYLWLGVIYFIISYLMADVSRRIERTGAGAVRRDTL